jgi:hypothetical protein
MTGCGADAASATKQLSTQGRQDPGDVPVGVEIATVRGPAQADDHRVARRDDPAA